MTADFVQFVSSLKGNYEMLLEKEKENEPDIETA